MDDIARMLQELSDEEKGDNFEDFDSDSDLSDENIVYDNFDSDSEQNISDEEVEAMYTDELYFTGKDKISKWRKTEFTKHSKTKKNNIIKTSSGLTSHSKNIESEIDSFMKIIDLDMVDEIVKYTNMYINDKKTTYNYSRDRDCKVTARSELLAYFGLLYLIGIKKGHHTNVLELWANDGTGIEITRAVMSYKRFLFITRCLRFDDRSTRADRRKFDKLSAIRSFLDSFVNNSRASYNKSEFTTIDEMLHPFRGRCQWIQYIPSKPAKYGIKMYALCDAKYFYTSNLEVYCGKQPEGPYDNSNAPMEIVKRLITDIEKSNRNLTTDNYYTSIPLAEYLMQKQITLVGTLKKNKREIPPEFLPHKNKAVSSSIFGFQKDKMLSSYVPRKNKTVILLSTMHDKGSLDNFTKKPEIIMDYNSTKGGVDTVDKMCATYTVSRITKRWPCVIFYSLMNIAGINAQVLYAFSKPNDAPNRRRIFLKNLSMSLMKEHLISRSKIKTLPMDVSVF
ncbi:piggyBac transposable element-derived protein 4-like [Rhopalosiphum padi]|uniref:piggyBac transposable element-derived protein 4-like n=1 Tax=Rhopalosiphum padi TaxID=40932 RepID=UPI00298E3063|nr:piggyBac transposable element-derived protein 4-like [Rhopalosiphum padi]